MSHVCLGCPRLFFVVLVMLKQQLHKFNLKIPKLHFATRFLVEAEFIENDHVKQVLEYFPGINLLAFVE